MLLGGAEMKKHNIDLVGSKGALASQNHGWRIPMSWRDRHFWADLDEGDALLAEKEAHEILFTKAELHSLRKKLGHASAQKLRSLLKRAQEDASNEDLQLLKDIGKECYSCQKLARSPMRHMSSIPEDIRLNHEIVMDLMHIDDKPILQIACAGARFAVAVFMPGKSAEAAWSALLRIWIKPCVGSPRILKADQGSEFVNDLFHRNSESIGVFLQEAPIESSNSMGLGERFHDPLRRIFLKLREDHPLLRQDAILKDARSAMSSTMGPEGYAAALLVYGMLPRLSIGSSRIATLNQAERMKALSNARSEMEMIAAKLRLKKARARNAPVSSLDMSASPGMLALACRKL